MGILRFYLAACVLIWHCHFVDHKQVLNSFAAVYCFFIMSGFYISMALSTKYIGPTGTPRFYANRATRLFPIYLVVLFATAMANALGFARFGVPGINGTFTPLLVLDQITVLPYAVWRNLTLDTDGSSNSLAIGWYYTVGLEMMFYALAPFFTRWKLPNLILLFIVSGIVHFVPYMMGLPDRQWQYEFFPSTAVFFVAGVLSYRLYLAIKDTANPHIGWVTIPAVIAYGFYFDQPLYTNSFEPFAVYAALALMLPFLFIASKGSTVDAFLGDLSYPFYVVHGLAAGLVGGGVGIPTNIRNALLLTIALSAVLHFLVDLPLRKTRDAIRGSKRPGPQPISATSLDDTNSLREPVSAV